MAFILRFRGENPEFIEQLRREGVHVSIPTGRVRPDAGPAFNVTICEVSGQFDQDIANAMKFLRRYAREINVHRDSVGEGPQLDVGIMDTEDIRFMRSHIFPTEFLTLLAELDGELCVTVYANDWRA